MKLITNITFTYDEIKTIRSALTQLRQIVADCPSRDGFGKQQDIQLIETAMKKVNGLTWTEEDFV